LLIKAIETFTEGETTHQSGDRWMVKGPCRYYPSTKVKIVVQRKNICLDKNEGIYVRDIRTGEVKLVSGETYMLKAHEDLKHYRLPADVDRLLTKLNGYKRTDTTRAITCQVPFNSAVQVYNFKEKRSTVAFGPCLVMLRPDE